MSDLRSLPKVRQPHADLSAQTTLLSVAMFTTGTVGTNKS